MKKQSRLCLLYSVSLPIIVGENPPKLPVGCSYRDYLRDPNIPYIVYADLKLTVINKNVYGKYTDLTITSAEISNLEVHTRNDPLYTIFILYY